MNTKNGRCGREKWDHVVSGIPVTVFVEFSVQFFNQTVVSLKATPRFWFELVRGDGVVGVEGV